MTTRAQSSNAIVAMLAAEHGCRESLFRSNGVHVVELPNDREYGPLQRRFSRRERAMSITSMWHSTVVAATSHWIVWARETFEGLSAGVAMGQPVMSDVSARIAENGYHLNGPALNFVANSSDIRAIDPPAGYELELGGPELADGLLASDWPHGIGPRPTRPTMFVSLSRNQGKTVGVATINADSDNAWQIGLDVAPDHRGRKLGAAMTSSLGLATLAQGKVPYYASRVENIPSMRTALSAGFVLTWAVLWGTEAQGLPLRHGTAGGGCCPGASRPPGPAGNPFGMLLHE